jgi:hypothetical protein
MKRRWLLLVVLLPALPVILLASMPGAGGQDGDYGDLFIARNGIISIEAEHYAAIHGWHVRDYYTGIGVTADPDTGSNDDLITYRVAFEEAGSYYLHMLGNRRRNSAPEDDVVEFTLADGEGRDVSVTRSGFPPLNAPAWSSVNFDHPGERSRLEVPGKGTYTLYVKRYRGEGFYLDKILLCSDPGFRPEGTGPEESCSGCETGSRDRIILPPRWAFGVMYGGYTDQKGTIGALDSLIEGDFPVDAYWIDSYFWDFNRGSGPAGYIDFTGDTAAFPDIRELWEFMGRKSIRSGIWIWDLILQSGNEPVFESFEEQGFFSSVFHYTNGWHNSTRNTMAGKIDFENPAAVSCWKERLKPFFDRGLDFLKLDNSSSIPFCRAAFTATQELGRETEGRGFILAHLHTTYDYRHKLYPAKWTGDAKIAWSQPDYPDLNQYAMGGLKENIAMVSDPNRSTFEIPFLSHDAGGYNYFGSDEQDDELFMRWCQFSSLGSMVMFFSTSDNPTRNHPYRYPEEVQENFRKYTHLRMRLFPYIYSCALKTHLTGRKMIRGDRDYRYQYLFGDEILVAPVFQKGAREREIDLPEGEWVDPETGTVYRGGERITMAAPLTKLPLLYRRGAVIPLRNYARAVELGSNDTLCLEVYPSGELTEFELLEDDGTSNDYLEGGYSKTLFSVMERKGGLDFRIAPVSGNYHGMGEERFYVIRINLSRQPASIWLNHRKLDSGWSYASGDQVTEVRLNTPREEGQRIKIRY